MLACWWRALQLLACVRPVEVVGTSSFSGAPTSGFTRWDEEPGRLVGGRAGEDGAESVPRFVCPTMRMGPTQAEVVNMALNFYGEDGYKLLKDPSWQGVLRTSQQELLLDYYDRCASMVRSGASVLRGLWNYQP